MTIKVGINGFGRIGRCTLSHIAASGRDDIEVIKINATGPLTTAAHLIKYDSVHGRFPGEITVDEGYINLGQNDIEVMSTYNLEELDWSGCDVVLECTGQFNDGNKAKVHLEQGAKRVLLSAPGKNVDRTVVYGVNDDTMKKSDVMISNGSCTTNCLAPVVKVIHEQIGIKHGSMTTIHSITNTQTILDKAHKDLRRARACGASLIPTTTGSATAITHIFPELKGKLNGHAVRVPLANASLTDCVFEVERATTEAEVNTLLRRAAENELKGILGYEERPLVSIDYQTDPRSAIIDALSTMVVNGTQVKLYTWYDNEWGYANRTAELVRMVGRSDQEARA